MGAGDGEKLRCFEPGRVYNPNLPLSTQAPGCSQHTYTRPFDEITIKAAVTYGTMALVEAPNQPPREEAVGVPVARDELKVSVNELQALDPGVSLAELFPPDAEGQVPDVAQIQLPPSDTPDVQREGEYFPEPPSGWDRFKDIGGTILKGAAVIAVGVVVAVAVLAVCSTGIGCVLLIGAAAGVAAGATAGGLFCGATLECIGKGALAGGVAGLAAAGAGLAAAALGAGALTTAVIGGGAAGFAGNLTDQLLGGGPIDPKSLAISTGVGMISGGLLSKFAPGIMSRFRASKPPPPPPPPAKAPAPPKAPSTPRPNLRNQYLGRTPDKFSATGTKVLERMRGESLIKGEGPLLRGNPNKLQLVTKDGPVLIDDTIDMTHRTDAVKWWNDKGRFLGEKSPEARKFMLDPDNCELQPQAINRSEGAKLKDRYIPLQP